MERIIEAIKAGRESGLIGSENYWLLLGKRSGKVLVMSEESYEKTPGYIGYFVLDDSRLPGIIKCYGHTAKRYHRE